MAEYVCAKIVVGGVLPISLVSALCAHVLAERAGPEWGVRFRDDGAVEQHLSDGVQGVTF